MDSGLTLEYFGAQKSSWSAQRLKGSSEVLELSLGNLYKPVQPFVVMSEVFRFNMLTQACQE